SAFNTLAILFCSRTEQKRIANVLNALDKEVMLLDSYVVMLQRQKTGLMQKLLTGKIRVKV
nr:restriction endonuclease subunit S [Bacteroidales bacterium]